MGKGRHLGEFEQSVLLALAIQKRATLGRDIYDQIVERTRRDVSLAAVYMTLQRLARKGYVKTGIDAPVDGGRVLKTFALTTTGAEALKVARADMDRLWRAARRHPFLQSNNS